MKNSDKSILRNMQASSFKRVDEIQSLWGGYGSIYRIELKDSNYQTAILKNIDLNQSAKEKNSVSYKRKLKSYQVETQWYKRFSKNCDSSCRVPEFVAAGETIDSLHIVLEDLDGAGFPLRKEFLKPKEMDACLFWLANFHSTFLGCEPQGLWKIGTYWNLGTRADEHRTMPKGKLKAKAHRFDTALNAARYQTFVHGDAKPANFCFSKDGWVAAVDFQYVGGGCGIKDVAYLMWGTSSKHESDIVSLYFDHLHAAVKTKHPNLDFEDLKNEWTKLYPVAQNDFKRFLEGWLPRQ